MVVIFEKIALFEWNSRKTGILPVPEYRAWKGHLVSSLFLNLSRKTRIF